MRDVLPRSLRIHVRDVEVECFLGWYEHEQHALRTIVVDITLDLTKQLYSRYLKDDIESTLNYERVVEAIRSTAVKRRFRLVESLCAELVSNFVEFETVENCQVRVCKPHPIEGVGSVMIEMGWQRSNRLDF